MRTRERAPPSHHYYVAMASTIPISWHQPFPEKEKKKTIPIFNI